MTRFHTSKPDAWVSPRPACDASQRLTTYGPIGPEAPDPYWDRHRLTFSDYVKLGVGIVILAGLVNVIAFLGDFT